MTYEDILYEERDGVARITINRPDRLNAFRSRTVDEMIDAFKVSAWNHDIGVIVLTGAGNRAFCVGGDQTAHDGQYDGHGTVGLAIEDLQSAIRDAPKPVIARVNGYAIGGGNVLATLCDLTIAAETAQFGQVGPKMGSVDAGFGTALLARAIGNKRAHEFWYLCRRYSAAEAFQMGLVNKVVPDAELDAEVDTWCADIMQKSPGAIALAKRSFHADTETIRGVSMLGMQALSFYYASEESKEGVNAMMEKRKPDFRKKRKT